MCTQDLEKRDPVTKLICALLMCSKCETIKDLNIDCQQCGKCTHIFWQDCIGKFIEYLRLSRIFEDKIYVMSHNSCGYEAQLLIRRFLEQRWVPKLIMDGMRILSMSVEKFYFLDSLNFLATSLYNMTKSFDLTCKKGEYPQFLTRPSISIM